MTDDTADPGPWATLEYLPVGTPVWIIKEQTDDKTAVTTWHPTNKDKTGATLVVRKLEMSADPVVALKYYITKRGGYDGFWRNSDCVFLTREDVQATALKKARKAFEAMMDAATTKETTQ